MQQDISKAPMLRRGLAYSLQGIPVPQCGKFKFHAYVFIYITLNAAQFF